MDKKIMMADAREFEKKAKKLTDAQKKELVKVLKTRLAILAKTE